MVQGKEEENATTKMRDVLGLILRMKTVLQKGVQVKHEIDMLNPLKPTMSEVSYESKLNGPKLQLANQ